MTNPERFRNFVNSFTKLVDAHGGNEATMLSEGGRLLEKLVAHDDWLPESCEQPHPQYYQQYLLHCDPLERFSVVSFVWGPGQKTPVHDHTVWGLVGVMRGTELCRRFKPGSPMPASDQQRLERGSIDWLSPAEGDIHEVANAYDDRVSISIHVYGGNIGAVRRHVFDAATGTEKPFVSGYSNRELPNFWDRSSEVRASIGGQS